MKVRVFRHLAFEDLDAFAGVLTAAGYTIEYAQMGVDAPDDADADLLVILGGPIGAYEVALYPWLSDDIAVIAARLKAAAPTWAFALAHN